MARKVCDSTILLVLLDCLGLHPPTNYFAKFKLDPTQDYFLEQTVHELAELESGSNATEVFEKHQRRKRRQADKPKKVPGLLAPFAFANNVGMPSFLGNLILSPVTVWINSLFVLISSNHTQLKSVSKLNFCLHY
jgi:hypothetical protein